MAVLRLYDIVCVIPVYREERSLARFTCVASVGLKDALARSCCVFLQHDSQGFLTFVPSLWALPSNPWII